MSDWFKSYWDQWIEHYDAGAQEKALGEAQKTLSSFTDRAVSRPWALISTVLAMILLFALAPRTVSLLRAPSPFRMLNRITGWLDGSAPEIYPGEPLPSRLIRVEWIDPSSKMEGEKKIQQLQSWVFDPTTPTPSRKERRRANQDINRLLASWGRMEKAFHKSQPSRKND